MKIIILDRDQRGQGFDDVWWDAATEQSNKLPIDMFQWVSNNSLLNLLI